MAGALAGDVGIEEVARIYAGATWAAEPARELAYRLFAICERKGLGEDAQRFNDLVAAWHLVRDKAANLGGPKARALF
jgi:putative DNA methylase